MERPLVSVIIPTYNRGSNVLDAVESVGRQTYHNVETVVVVDGSTDDTLQILDAYRETLPIDAKNRFRIVAQDNQGVSSARNNGVRSAGGPVIAFLDDDDRWHPVKLAQQVAELQKHPADNRLMLCTTDYRTVNPRTGEQEIIRHENPVVYEKSLITFPPPSAWLLPRGAFEAVGGFDLTLKRGEDSDFLIKLRKAEAIFVNVTEPLMTYTLPHQGKIYGPNDVEAAATLLERHGLWYREALPPEICDRMMSWYQRILPGELYEAVVTKLDTAQRLAPNTDVSVPSRTRASDEAIAKSGKPGLISKKI